MARFRRFAGTNMAAWLWTGLTVGTCMLELLGALIGGLHVLKVDTAAPLALATGLLAIVALFAHRASRSTPAVYPWRRECRVSTVR
jgi:hypothetical protein